MRHSKVFRSFNCHNTNDNEGFLWRIQRILNELRKRKKEKFSIVVSKWKQIRSISYR